MNTSSTHFGIWILLAVLLVVFSLARRSVPANDANGFGFADDFVCSQLDTTESANAKQVLTVASFNIQTGKSAQGHRNIHRAAETIVNADIVGVQEVYARSWANKLGWGQSQTVSLARRGEFYYGFHPTRKRWFDDHRGNALLTKLPVQAWRTTMLPDQSGKSFRNFTTAELQWQGQRLVVINTHLHTGVGRDEQLVAVINEFEKHSRVVLLGDFNTSRSSIMLQTLLTQQGVIDAIGALQLDPEEDARIDWIITKGFRAVGGHFLPKGVSDHPYYEVQLVLEGLPGKT